jgi:predicted MFS family arabinose efflux permease
VGDKQPVGGVRRRWWASLASHHDFRQLWVGDTISQFGTSIGLFAVQVLVVTLLDADAFEVGLLATFQTIAFLLVGLPAGALVDRWSKRTVLIAGDIVRGIAYLAIPIAWWLDALSLPLVLGVVLAAGVATVFFDVAYQSYLPLLVPADRVSEGNAKLQISHSLAHVTGEGLSGLLIRALGAPVVILLDALSFLGSVWFTVRIRHRERLAPRQERPRLHTAINEGVAFVAGHRLLRRIIGSTALGNLALAMANALFTLYALRTLGINVAVLGLAMSVGAVGGVVGALIATTVIRRLGEGRTIALSLLPSVPAVAVWPVLPQATPAVAAVLIAATEMVIAAALVVYNVAQVSFRQRVCPRPLLGRMNASVRFVVWGTQPVGAFLGGVLGAAFGIVPTLVGVAAMNAVAVLPVLVSPLRTMRATSPSSQP